MAKKRLNKKSTVKIPPVVTGTRQTRELMSAVGLKKNEVNRRERVKKSRLQWERETNRNSKTQKRLGAGHAKGKK